MSTPLRSIAKRARPGEPQRGVVALVEETEHAWRRWSYAVWNRRLIDKCLRGPPGSAPVEQFEASPDDLAALVGAAPALAAQVARAFVECMVGCLPVNQTSFCGFCYRDGSWRPDSKAEPPFFAMLWFTCLIAYGYPTSEGGFFKRFWDLLGKTDNFQFNGTARLADLWRDVAQWTVRRSAAGDAVRVLELPPEHEHRRVIGFSHFLAFPTRADRNALARVLWDSNLIGFEPPVTPVVELLMRYRDRFSSEFREDLEEFSQRVAAGDESESAFWRAVRREAIDPSIDSPAYEQSTTRREVRFLSDDGLLPIIVTEEQIAPVGFDLAPFESAVEDLRYVVRKSGETTWDLPFSQRGRPLLSVGTRKVMDQGVLVLRELSTGHFSLALGREKEGCEVALVRTNTRAAFVKAFGGSSSPSLLDGWEEVFGARITHLDRLPAGLEKATQLLKTLAPREVGFVGGVRVAGGFLAVPGFLPLVRARGAVKVSAGASPCRRIRETPDWELSPEVCVPGELVVEATWEERAPTTELNARTTSARLCLLRHAVDDAFKGKPAGTFLLESCPEPERDVTALEELPLAVTGAGPTNDLLAVDSTATFLGAGLGELFTRRLPGCDWVVSGTRASGEVLTFVGDPSAPATPTNTKAGRERDHAFWRRAWHARRVYWKRGSVHERIENAPQVVRAALDAFRAHEILNRRFAGAPERPASGHTSASFAAPSRRLVDAFDVLAALACRRSGLAYSDVREVFRVMTAAEDPSLLQHALRAWTEAGVVDVLRRSGVSRLLIVPRRPRFVVFTNGPDTEATLIGLVTSIRRQRLDDVLANDSSVHVRTIPSVNGWQLDTLRIRGSFASIANVSSAAGLEAPEWLAWGSAQELASHFDVARAAADLPRGAPPPSYVADGTWDWQRGSFRRARERNSDKVSIERRRHADASTVYVVASDGKPVQWSANRAWALLVGYAAAGKPSFSETSDGLIVSSAGVPLHLPLTLARLCACVGEALPGPVPTQQAQLEYCYPFGPRYAPLATRMLPREWTLRTR